MLIRRKSDQDGSNQLPGKPLRNQLEEEIFRTHQIPFSDLQNRREAGLPTLGVGLSPVSVIDPAITV
jgi:hypothetical protein